MKNPMQSLRPADLLNNEEVKCCATLILGLGQKITQEENTVYSLVSLLWPILQIQYRIGVLYGQAWTDQRRF